MSGLPISTIDTGVVPARDRLAYWLDMATQSHFPCTGRSDNEMDFRASMRVLRLDAVQVADLTYSSLDVYRTAKLIRQSDPEVYQLNLVQVGNARHAQDDKRVVLRPGHLVLRDSSRPFHTWRAADTGHSRAIVVQFPRSALHLPHSLVDRIVGVPVSAREGSGALLTSVLTHLLEHPEEYRSTESNTVERIVLDLIAATCVRELPQESTLPGGSRKYALFLQIRQFVQQRLGDPCLTPPVIAAAHHISVRYLHQIFETYAGEGVAAWIRWLRLESCRRDLADRGLSSRPVHRIAARRGFTDPAHFSRQFRAAFGMSPTAYRSRHTVNVSDDT